MDEGKFITEFINQTYNIEFILLGFGNHQILHIPLYLLFFIIYIGTMAGNLLIILLVVLDQHLHTPMYIFLGNLSCLETCCSTNILPRMLSSFLTGSNMISLRACFVQHYFFGSLGAVECYLLSAMSYDRYIAICKPLHYVIMMNDRMCFRLIAFSWMSGFLATSVTQFIMSQSVFCDNKIDHFFCDTFPIVDLFCGDTHAFKMFLYVLCSIFTFPPSVLTLTSYTFIVVAVMRMPSTLGKQKAFSTCSSHLLVVTIFYGILMSIYVVPNGNKLNGLRKVLSLFYTILTPMLNPIIYTLRNKEVKNALRRLCYIFVHISRNYFFLKA
ncbi:olfactory receptor 2AP1-like [Thamnophis elegans]|uniref:olfactory receptor 2AP1-like n=1 Tax=Thamnophis elegans TaxID=35005 RepID=UPI001378970B|nr:olfactory receptor 2AP1-like [Thamnophis elegans]